MDTRELRAPPDSSGGAASRSRARQARSPLTLLARLGSAEASGIAAGEESPDARPLGSQRLAPRCCMLVRAAAEARTCSQCRREETRLARPSLARRQFGRRTETEKGLRAAFSRPQSKSLICTAHCHSPAAAPARMVAVMKRVAEPSNR